MLWHLPGLIGNAVMTERIVTRRRRPAGQVCLPRSGARQVDIPPDDVLTTCQQFSQLLDKSSWPLP
jgi:hypothetical protein